MKELYCKHCFHASKPIRKPSCFLCGNCSIILQYGTKLKRQRLPKLPIGQSNILFKVKNT